MVWSTFNLFAQPAPAIEENIPFLVTFGADSEKSWGDDDFCQIFFIKVPSDHNNPVYLRIYDPDIWGENDENKGNYDTKVRFSVYGGRGCWTVKDARNIDPVGNYNSGLLLASRTFGAEEKYDGKWYTFGPLNPYEGEYVEEFDGRIFKVVAQGISGNDGNLYKYFLSTDRSTNIEVEGGNLFTYEYTFRLANDSRHVSQIYPYIDDETISIEVSNFDWDNDGKIRIISVAKNGIECPISNQGNWITENFVIEEEEKNTSVEVQFIKNQQSLVMNNNVVVVVRNQYGESLPFFVIPIGGIPVYKPKIKMKSTAR